MSLFRSMGSLFRSEKPRVRENRFTPRLEQLDERVVPTITSMSVNSAGTLNIYANYFDDTVTIKDLGTNSAGNVQVTANGSTTTFSKPVLAVEIWDLGGTNTWTYNSNSSQGVSSVIYHGGYQKDNFFFNLNQGVSSDRLIQAQGQGGDDTLQVTLKGTVRSGHGVGVSMEGGSGFDSVGVDAKSYSPTIERDATLWASLSGFYHDRLENTQDSGNNVGFHYLGRMDGNLYFNLMGSSGADWVSANVWANGGSTGTIQDGSVRGGGGTDDLDFIIRGDTGLKFGSHQYVDGGTGYDTLNLAWYGRATNLRFEAIYGIDNWYQYDADLS